MIPLSFGIRPVWLPESRCDFLGVQLTQGGPVHLLYRDACNLTALRSPVVKDITSTLVYLNITPELLGVTQIMDSRPDPASSRLKAGAAQYLDREDAQSTV
jgi:hypothetical protein